MNIKVLAKREHKKGRTFRYHPIRLRLIAVAPTKPARKVRLTSNFLIFGSAFMNRDERERFSMAVWTIMSPARHKTVPVTRRLTKGLRSRKAE